MNLKRELRHWLQEEASQPRLSAGTLEQVLRRSRFRRVLSALLSTALLISVMGGVGIVAANLLRNEQKSAGTSQIQRPVAPPVSPPAIGTLAEVPVHSCGNRLVGEGGVSGEGEGRIPQDWRAQSIMAGPVGFFSVSDWASLPASRFQPVHDGRYLGIAFYAIVEAGRTVTIMVPDEEAHRLSILSDPEAGGGPPFKFGEGERALALEACPSSDTEFLEGFIAAGPHCAPLDVFTGDRQEPHRVLISFGVGRCG